MAEKRSRELPDGFALNTGEDLPVSLGDFLDEDQTRNRVLARMIASPATAVPPQPVPAQLTQGDTAITAKVDGTLSRPSGSAPSAATQE